MTSPMIFPQTTTYTDPDTGRTFRFKRPTIGGLEKMARERARALSQGGPGTEPFLDHFAGLLIEGKAVLAAYLDDVEAESPGGWKRDPVSRAWLINDVEDHAEFARVMEAAKRFHATFRAIDVHFGNLAGQIAD